MNHNPIPSSCSCNLPDNQWGQGGWHWYRPTYMQLLEIELAASAKTDTALRNLLYLAKRGRLSNENARDLDRYQVINEAHFGAIAKAAEFMPWAIEPCPGYLETVRRDINDEKHNKRAESHREVI